MSGEVIDVTGDEPPVGAKRSANDLLRTLTGEREARRGRPSPALAPALQIAPAPARIGRPDEQWIATATCSRVRVMRGGDNPVIAFENFGGDRGLRLSEIARIRKTLEENRNTARTNSRMHGWFVHHFSVQKNSTASETSM